MDHSLEERLYMIGQFTSLLDHCASLLPFIAEDEDKRERHHVWVSCTNSFTTDFRALYYFMFRPNSLDADRTDFVVPTHWKPSETAVTQRLKEFATFIDKHRAHLSWERFDSELSGLSGSSEHRDSVKPRGKIPDYYLSEDRLERLKAVGYVRVLADYLDVLDEFILELPRKSKEQWLFAGASGVARNGVNSFMGLPPAKSLMLDVFGDEPVEEPPF